MKTTPSKMKILFSNNTEEITGCTLYRNIIPARGLADLGHTVKFMPINEFDFDIVVFNRNYEGNIVEYAQKIKDHGTKIVYEIDDMLWKLEDSNPAKGKINVKTCLDLMRMADLVTTTTEYLKKEIQKKTKVPVVVIPNSVLSLEVPKVRNDKVRVGYAGFATHYKDLDFILDVILDLQKTRDFEFVTMGIGKEDHIDGNKISNPLIKKDFLSCQEKISRVKSYSFVEPAKPLEFISKLNDANFDIGLCPLGDSDFNRCKSAVKFYEYAILGVATLASKVEAYEECDCTAKPERFSDWRSKLANLVDNSLEMKSVAHKQEQYVRENRVIDVIKYDWEKAFRNLLKNS